MTLANFVSETDIAPQMAAGSRWEAIDELLDLMSASGTLTETLRATASEALVKRERSMSTGIGKGVAIPHAQIDGLEKPVGGFGRSVQGIEFEAPDQKPVHLVMLFLVPKKEFRDNVQTLAAIARFLSLPDQKQRLLDSNTSRAIFSILRTERSANLD